MLFPEAFNRIRQQKQPGEATSAARNITAKAR